MTEDFKNYFDGYALFYKGECYPVNKFKFEYSVNDGEWEETTPENFDYLQAKGTKHKLRITPMNTTEPTPEGSKRSKAKSNRILYCESCKEYKAENANLRAALAELIEIAEFGYSVLSVNHPRLLEYKSAIERAKRITNGKD